MSLKQRKIKLKPRIKLNHNMDKEVGVVDLFTWATKSMIFQISLVSRPCFWWDIEKSCFFPIEIHDKMSWTPYWVDKLFLRNYVHQWRVLSIVVLTLVNFPRNSHVLRDFPPIKLAFNYLGLYLMGYQFLANNMHFITYSACMEKSPDRQQPNKEPTL